MSKFSNQRQQDHDLDDAEHTRRDRWLRRHGHSPVQLLHLDTHLIKTTGIHLVDWGRPASR
ncbi:hypothetical protein ACIOWI_33455 [Streptomyces sp. NPDC087659]|uniref:hypothetical protein n=1 Tax=Streptomyces sp. NPDC087659 TaxID=3365801 RepID=UPI0037F7521E